VRNEQSIALQPGSHIGDLQINEVLGLGSYAITYLVTDPAIGTRFALKEYLPAGHVSRLQDGRLEPVDENAQQHFTQGLKQFLFEARMVAALDHPNIVKVLRYFEQNATAYFLMPYYQGQALHHLLESNGPLGPEDARDLLLSLMDGLEYIHTEGVIHQDIKPANIYMTENGRPILLDFGVAAMHNLASPTDPRFGSEGYAAPEQASADGSIGPWTDIYALAASLYRSISGVIPVSSLHRKTALDEGKTDPLKPISEIVSDRKFGGIKDAINQGLRINPQDRPHDIAQWKKSFKSLDWLRTVATDSGFENGPKEGIQWLPRILLGGFVVIMVAVGIFLLTERSPDDIIDLPDFSGTRESPSSQGGQRVAEPTSEETSRWQAALQADTILAYRRFIEDYPISIYTPQAETQLDILDEKAWQELSVEDSVPAYEDYLELFPDGLHQAEAMVRIDEIKQEEAREERARLEQERLEQQAWDEALSSRTIASFDQYIAAWPSGLHI
jgi:serine/threonine protein kinase